MSRTVRAQSAIPDSRVKSAAQDTRVLSHTDLLTRHACRVGVTATRPRAILTVEFAGNVGILLQVFVACIIDSLVSSCFVHFSSVLALGQSVGRPVPVHNLGDLGG